MQNHIEFKGKEAEFKMIFVEGGIFEMGSNERESQEDEKPVHKVQVNSFWMSEYLVTQAIWVYIMKENPSRFRGANRIVENVSYNDIVNEFLPRLNKMTSRSEDNEYRLPTEAEWEYAAKGGKYGHRYPFTYAGSNKLEEVGWYDENSHGETQIVGLKTPNLLGLYDMSGNVYEWCSDWYAEDFYRTSTGRILDNPIGPITGPFRVYHGGSWDYAAHYCRSTNRAGNTPTDRDYGVGFRLVRSLRLTELSDDNH